MKTLGNANLVYQRGISLLNIIDLQIFHDEAIKSIEEI